MNPITVIVLIFSFLAIADKIFGDRFGLGKELENAFRIFCPMMLSMLGMLIVSPAIGQWMMPVFEGFYNLFGIDPSVIPASLFANDMGGQALSLAICKSEAIGNFNAYVVSSMLGCVISFTSPFSIGVVKPHQHRDLFFGTLCGIATVPVGCFVAGLMCGLDILTLLLTLLPLLIFAFVIGFFLILFPNGCIKAFTIFGHVIRIIALLGLACAIFTFLTKIPVVPYFETMENASAICVNACITLSGTMPLMFLVSKVLNKPMTRLGSCIGVDGISAIGFLSSLVTNATTFGVMDRMNRKGVVLNAAFSVSASYVFGSHLAFTMAFDSRYVAPVIVGKLVSGIAAIVLSCLIFKEPQPDTIRED